MFTTSFGSHNFCLMHSETVFLRNTKAIRKALNLDLAEYISIFQLSSTEAKKILLNPKDFPLKYAMNFSEFFGLDLMSLFSESFDINAFARQHLSGSPDLPEKYQLEKNSRVITLINLAKGLIDSDMSWLNDLIFRRLQIPTSLLLYPEQEIPVKLIVDYLQLYEDYRGQLSLMQDCGKQGIANLNLQFNLVDSSTIYGQEFYDDFFSQRIKQFDKSYDYKVIKIKNDELTLKCSLKDEFKDIYQATSLSNVAFLNYKTGIASGLSALFGYESSLTSIMKSDKEKGIDLLNIKLPKPLSTSQSYLH